MTGRRSSVFSSFTAVLFKIAEIPYAGAVVLTVTAAMYLPGEVTAWCVLCTIPTVKRFARLSQVSEAS